VSADFLLAETLTANISSATVSQVGTLDDRLSVAASVFMQDQSSLLQEMPITLLP
jgi:hypothetical protein